MEKIHARILTVILSIIISITSSANTMTEEEWDTGDEPSGVVIDYICYRLDSQTHEASIINIRLGDNRNAFQASRSLSSINIPSTIKYDNVTYKVTSIGSRAFELYENLTSITIPNTVTFIGDRAFWYCHNLSSITLPNSIKKIEEDAFCACYNLKSIIIPASVTKITNSFAECKSLSSLVIPSSVTYIDKGAFSGCNALKSVTVKSPTPVTLYKKTFEVFGELHVPAGSKKAYSKAPIWKNFTIIEDVKTGIESIQGNPILSSDKIFTLSGQHLTAPQKGVNIINGKKVVVK